MYGEIEFSKDVIEEFGVLIPELSEDSNMLHTQMTYLADGIRENLSSKHKILKFVESVLLKEDAILEIENAVAISFIELEELPTLGIETSIPTTILRILTEQQKRWLGTENT